MSDYGTMQDRIAGELFRSDLSSQIASAIQSAIAASEKERYSFNEERVTTNTVKDQEFYDQPDDMIEEDSILINISGTDYDLVPKSYKWIEENRVSTTYTGYPQIYAKYQKKFRLYPIPNGAFPMTVSYIKRLPALASRSDTNDWMVEGERVIRYLAKKNIFIDVTRNPSEAVTADLQYNIALRDLQSLARNLVGIGKLRGSGI